jgi:hypothetical protein
MLEDKVLDKLDTQIRVVAGLDSVTDTRDFTELAGNLQGMRSLAY